MTVFAFRSAFALTAAFASVVCLVPIANAGGGQVIPIKDGVETKRAEIKASVYVDLPRTQKQYVAFEEQMRAANQLICDYTDGRFRLSELRYVHGPSEKRTADILWFSRDGRANADTASFGTSPGENPDKVRGSLRLFKDVAADTIAHELGHLVFGALDHYPDIRGTDNKVLASTSIDGLETFTDPEGRVFFRTITYKKEAAAPVELRFEPKPGASPMTAMGTPVYPDRPADAELSSAAPWWLVNNSIMQQSTGVYCREAFLGLSADQVNPVLFGAMGCSSQADTNGDGIHDDCASYTWKECSTGPTTRCTTNADCSVGTCSLTAGYPICGVSNLNTASELTTKEHNDLTRFNRTRGAMASRLPTGDAHIREAKHLVVQGYLFPSSQGQPNLGTGGDKPCFDRELKFDSSPAGVCKQECDPAIDNGADTAVASHSCTASSRSRAPCPFSDLPSSPNNPACTASDNPICGLSGFPRVAQATCDRCVVGNSEACDPMFGTFALTSGSSPFCGDGVVDVAAAPMRRVEQCDNGTAATHTPDVTAPLPKAGGGVMTCADVDPSLVGELRCQSNCFYDLSRCAKTFLPTSFAPGSDSVVSLIEARQQSTVTAFAEVYDGKGKVGEAADAALSTGALNLRAMGPSNHGVFLFMKRALRQRSGTGDAWPTPASMNDHRYKEIWQLTVAMDDAEFGGAPGTLREIRKFELAYVMDYVANTSILESVNGRECLTGTPSTFCLSTDDSGWPQVFLGYDASEQPASDPYAGATGKCVLPGCDQPQTATGHFRREVCDWKNVCTTEPDPAKVALRLDLRNLAVKTVEGPVGGLFNSVVSAYARHSVDHTARREIPQLGNTRYRLGMWNPICASDPNHVCCYDCANPKNPIPAECQNAATHRDWCQDQDRAASFMERSGFNEDHQRYETARSTRKLLERHAFGAGADGTFDAVAGPDSAHEEQQLTNALASADGLVDSDWDMLQKTIQKRWGITFPMDSLPTSGARVHPHIPAGSVCPDPTIIGRSPGDNLEVSFNRDLQIVFVLDRSGSMGVSDTSLSFGEPTVSRLDYVKAAARSFLDDVMKQVELDNPGGPQFGPKIGVVWYSDIPEVTVPRLSTLPCKSDAECTASNACVARGGSQRACASNTGCSDGDICINQVCAKAAQSVCAENLRFLARTATADSVCAADPNNCASDINDIKSKMVMKKNSGVAESPTPGGDDGGYTSSGAALEAATHLFNPGRAVSGMSMPSTRIIVMLSDGGHNRPKGGFCLGPTYCERRNGSVCEVGKCDGKPCKAEGSRANDPGCWPTSVADERFENALANARMNGIQIYAMPLANATDKAAAAVESGQVTGQVFESLRNYGEDSVPAFSEARAATRGEQLATTHHTLPYVESQDIEELGYVYLTSQIQVEPGARSLTARLSDYDALDGQGFTLGPNANSAFLVAPNGTAHSFFALQPADGVSGDVEPLSATLRVVSPMPGTWKIQDRAPPVGPDGMRMRFYTSAAVENPAVSCYAEASLPQSDGSKAITISAQANYDGPLQNGVTYTGTLLRPDFTVIALDFQVDAKGMGRALVRPTDLAGSGSYKVSVACDVANGALVDPGENLPGTDAIEFPVVRSSAFQRQVATNFFVQNGGLMPVPGIVGNNQSQAELNKIASRIKCGPGVTCRIPLGLAPVVPFLNDADGDGIPNSQEPAANVDSDGDGRPDVFDADANNNERADGNDPCLRDVTAPVLTAASVTTTTCTPSPTNVSVSATATDTCGTTTLVGQLLTAGGKTVPGSVPVQSGAQLTLPPGTSTIRWTATDSGGNSSTATQIVTVQTTVNAATCCQTGAKLVNGSDFIDWIYNPFTNNYCVFAKGASDTVDLGRGTSFVSGGTGNDHIELSGDHDMVVGDAGNDVIELLELCTDGSIYGGDGDDWLELVGDGVIYGNGGKDSIHAWAGRQEIVPGPGRDFVDAGFDDDVVRINHVCEVASLEVLDGGPGNDTLYTPVPLSQLNSLGVIVLSFENVVVTNANQHLSECLP